MFHYDRGLKITAIDLAVDFTRRQPRGFISHAHTDHLAKHELAYCTPETAALYHHRSGQRPVKHLPFDVPHVWDKFTLTTHPAGHILGAAMLHVQGPEESLLYTGDFRLGQSLTAGLCQPPHADILVMESTFGDPKYRLPPREEVIGRLLELVKLILERGQTPVIQAYVLGKSQEVTKILTQNGFSVLHHPLVHEISQIYKRLGCDLGDCELYDPQKVAGKVIVVPPRRQKSQVLAGLRNTVSLAVTGWAQDPMTAVRLGVDHALPLSDHADYTELIACVEQVQPRVIYCTHGPDGFVDRLCKLGHMAFPLAGGRMLV